MKTIIISLFFLGLLLIIPTGLMAQEAITQTSGKNDKWLRKQDMHLKDEMTADEYQNTVEATSGFTELREPFTHQHDFNEMVREKMAWDKNLSSEKSYLDRCRLSLGVIKVNKLMGGAMLKVKLFD